MTISSTINREQYATNGVTTAFTIHFPFFNETDVNAVIVDGAGNATTLSLNADYTVIGGGAGGTLTCTVAPLSGGTLTIYREIPFTQEDDYVEDDPLPADTLEGGFDRAVIRDQQLKDAQDRALTFPVTIPAGVSAVLPFPLADAMLGWASDGLSIENKVLEPGTTVYASTANTNAGTATNESVTPKSLHDSIYNTDDTTVLVQAATVTTGTGKVVFRQPRKITLESIIAGLKTAQSTGAILTVDINVNGTSILSTKLTIDNTEKTSGSAAIQPVISSATINAGDEVSFDVDQVGDGTAVMLTVGLKGRLDP